MASGRSRLVGALGSMLLAEAACAQWQWTASKLHPAGALRSQTFAVWGDQQGGSVFSGVTSRPGLWQGASQSWTPLASGPGENGTVWGMSPGMQVGDVGGFAALWHGTPESRVPLNPPSALASYALGVHGDQQVGYTHVSDERAALWRGTAESYVNLHPAGAVRSMALATDGVRQGGWVGYATPLGVIRHATIWDGNASSITDLNPGTNFESNIAGMVPGTQVGYFQAPGGLEHAAVWHGSSQSFEDWNPTTSPYTRLLATTGTYHVGFGSVQGSAGQVALLWLGSPNNVVNLQALLPSNYFLSEATSVWEGDGRLIVGGWAQDAATSQKHAFVWIGVPAPGTALPLLAASLVASRRRPRRAPYARFSSLAISAVLG